jgi:hypothetical protein
VEEAACAKSASGYTYARREPEKTALCEKCHSQLRLIALVKTEAVAQKILKAMRLPSDIPELHPARRPRPPPGDTSGGDDWLN